MTRCSFSRMGDTQSAQREDKQDAAVEQQQLQPEEEEEERGEVDDAQTEQIVEAKVSRTRHVDSSRLIYWCNNNRCELCLFKMLRLHFFPFHAAIEKLLLANVSIRMKRLF